MRQQEIILGRAVSGRDITLDLCAPHHLLITGSTRSGKSAQLYEILAQCKGLPVQIAGIDPSGIVFAALGDSLGGGLRVLTLRDAQRCIDVMTEILAEMDNRIDGLLEQRHDKIDDYTEQTPLMLVVMEEYPGLLAALSAIDTANGSRGKDKAETQIKAAVQRIAMEGAKVGIRLVLLAQRADAVILGGALRAQLTARLTFRTDADGARMLHESIEPEQIEAMARFSPGVGYIEVAGVQELEQYRADYISYADLVRLFS